MDKKLILVVAIAPGGRLLVNRFTNSHDQSLSMKLSRWRKDRDYPFLPIGILEVQESTIDILGFILPWAGASAGQEEWLASLEVERRFLPVWGRHVQTLAPDELLALFTDYMGLRAEV